MSLMIGPMVAEEGGFKVCALLKQTQETPLHFDLIGYAVFSSTGSYMKDFPDSVAAMAYVREAIENDVFDQITTPRRD